MLFLPNQQQPKILILGDLILDHYLNGTVERISPEAPVPVFLHKSEEYRLGGAANVALNLLALGAKPILLGLIGNDHYGTELTTILEQKGINSLHLFKDPTRQTTCKTRFISHGQQLLRYDKEDTHNITTELETKIINQIEELCTSGIDCLIFQDYNKGLLTKKIIQQTIIFTKKYNILSIVDPKKENFLNYHGISLFKPNLKEINEGLGIQIQNKDTNLELLEAAALQIEKALDNKYTLITLGAKGLYLKQKGEKGQHYPTRPRTVSDVCGAGDTVVSVLAYTLAKKFPLNEVATLANLAGGQVCEQLGVVPLNATLLEEEYIQYQKL